MNQSDVGKTYSVIGDLLRRDKPVKGFVGKCVALEEQMLVNKYGQSTTALMATLRDEEGREVECIPGELEEVYTSEDIELEGQVLATFSDGDLELRVIYSANGYQFSTRMQAHRFYLGERTFDDIQKELLARFETLLDRVVGFAEAHFKQQQEARLE